MIKFEEAIQMMKVLYVEDEDISRTIVHKILKKKTKNLFLATNGQEGLELFKTYKPDIIITDLRMPILDGISMIKKIRSFDQDCGIIITTESSETNMILQSVDIGIDKYIIKPLNDEKIEEALKIVMKKMHKRISYNKLFDNLLEFNIDDKKKIEDEIKNESATFLKRNIGKGPKCIKVIISQDVIEIRGSEVLTSMEKALIKDKNNINLVEYNRQVFYKSKINEIEKKLSDIIGREVRIDKIHIDVLSDEDRMVFKCLN